MKEQGILYCATSKKYIERAKLSAESIRRFHPDMSFTLATMEKINGNGWDMIVQLKDNQVPANLNMIYKLNTLLLSPYKKTLYLDSDTYALGNIGEIFRLLDRFELVLCHGHNRKKRFDIYDANTKYHPVPKNSSKKLPYAFAPVQGGLIGFINTRKMTEWLKTLLRRFSVNNFYDDQFSIRELLWETDIQFYILPPEYNFNSIEDLKRWRKSHYREAIPKIMHYTKYENRNIPKLVNKYYSINKSDWQYLDLRYRWLPENLRQKLKDFYYFLKECYQTPKRI